MDLYKSVDGRFYVHCPRGPRCPGLDNEYLPTLHFSAVGCSGKEKQDLPCGRASLFPAANQ